MKYALINATTYDFLDYKENQYIIFEESILEIGNMGDFRKDNMQVIDCKNHLVLPSLVVGHTHIYSTFARGLSVEFHPQNFLELLDQLWWKIDRNLDNEMNYYSAIVSAVDYMKNGVTTMIDHHASGEIKGSLISLQNALSKKAKLRAMYCFETSDRFDIDACIHENLDFMNQFHSSLSKGLFGLHASLSLSEDTLRKVKKEIGDSPIHIHVAESEMDQENCQTLYHERVVERLDRHGLLQKNSILSHCIFVNDHELDIIKERGCVIAFNISSNMNNGVGLPNYQKIKTKGIPVIIGNDGISSSITTEYLALYYAMHLQENSPTGFSLQDLKAIIRQTYQYVNEMMHVKIGNIQVGYLSDLLILPYVAPTPLNKDNILGHLFFGCFNSFKPKHVFCNGEHLVNHYQVSSELEKEYEKAQQIAKKCWDKIEKENDNELKN
jgi:cytosine/adenosine deaminase-related metal-dependent hydrolase